MAGVLLIQAVSIHAMQVETVDEAAVSAAKTEAGTESVLKTEPEVKSESAPQAEPETKPESAAQAEPEARPESAPQAEPEAKPESAAQAEPEAKPESAPQAEPETKPEPAPAETGEIASLQGGAEDEKSEDGQEGTGTLHAAGEAEADPGEPAGVYTSEEASTETGTEVSGDGLTAEAASETSTEFSGGYGEAEPGKTEEEAEEISTESVKENGEASLSNVTIQQDGHGAFFTYNSDHNRSLTFSLYESDSQVGQSVTRTQSAPSESKRVYFLELDNNMFGLSPDDIGRTITLSINYVTDNGSEEVCRITEEIRLTEPSLSLPSFVNCSALSKTEDLYDVTVVSGISWTNGSCVARRIVEKQSGGSWVEIPDGKAFTSADAGLYRVRIQTCLGQYYSNNVTVAVPVADLQFETDPAIGSPMTVKPVGPDGTEVQIQSFAWYLGDETALQGSELIFTPQLKELIRAQTTSLRLEAKDMIGNTFTKYVTLKPLDLAKASLRFGEYVHPKYDGSSKLPDAALLLDDYELPKGLYTVAAAADRNCVNAGDAWGKVTGDGTWLAGTADVKFVIDPAKLNVDEDDFVTSFDYDGNPHKPVLKDEAAQIGELKYEKWQKKDGSWTDIKEAPVKSGTYRVNVTVEEASGNYKKAVFNEMEFTIRDVSEPKPETRPETKQQKTKQPKLKRSEPKQPESKRSETQPEPVPQPQASPADLTVTDAVGNPVGYRSRDITFTGESGEAPQSVLEISADPVKQSDGSPLLDENGKIVYRQCNLHITPALMKNMQSRRETIIRFVLGEAAVHLDVSALDASSAYAVKLAPLTDADLTGEEKTVLAGYQTGPGIYAVRVVREETGADVTEKIGSSGALEITLDVTRNDGAAAAGILFLKEDRTQSPAHPVPSASEGERVRQEGREYLKLTVPGCGIFSGFRG